MLSLPCKEYVPVFIISPQFKRKFIEDYWGATPTARMNIPLPVRRFEVARKTECSDTTFFLTLHGTIAGEILKFKVPCRSEQLPISKNPPLLQKYCIKIISEMYDNDCSIMKGLKGEHDRSGVYLVKDDVHCIILLCEISFHLFHWKDVGLQLAMRKVDLDVIEAKNIEFFEKALEMLMKWLTVKTQPNLQTLIQVLNSFSYSLQVSSYWTTSCTVRPKTMDTHFLINVADYIQRHWKFVAYILGEERYIMDAEREGRDSYHEQACKMLINWRKHYDQENAYIKLFNSIHCVYEHLPLADYLKTALTTFLL